MNRESRPGQAAHTTSNGSSSPSNSNTLAPHHAEMLDKAGIASEVIAERGYWTAQTKQELAALGLADYQQNVPSLVIPITNASGDIATYQVRPDRPRHKGGKPIKYETLAGSRLAIDVPPRVRPWLRDRTRDLFVTEGSKKADSAASRGLACVALLGVWSWRDKDGTLADWEDIGLKQRRVYIAFDSDVMEKESVCQSLDRLRSWLIGKGADVWLIYLPSGGTRLAWTTSLPKATP
jgi:hypothetical protein